jgi:hypothetical protein
VAGFGISDVEPWGSATGYYLVSWILCETFCCEVDEVVTLARNTLNTAETYKV